MLGSQFSTPRTVGATSAHFGPSQAAPVGTYIAGDFILTHGAGVFSQLIRFGQRLRFRGANRVFAWWNHAAMIVSSSGDLIEALGSGVQRSHLEKYAPKEYTLVCLGDMATAHDRRQVVAYAEWALNQEYGILTIVSIAISLIMGGKFTFGYDGQSICSGLVARALERTDAIFARSPSHIMPADLAKVFNMPPGGQVPRERAPLKPAK